MYAIPLKLTEILGIPLRSFGMTAYPRMSKKFISGDLKGLRETFYGYAAVVTTLFVPIAVLCFIWAPELILFLGGEAYVAALSELVLVFRIFTAYTLLLPLDRFTGVLFDSINKPDLNLYKVLVMALLNIGLNCIAVFLFRSLIGVAIGTFVFTLVGILLGMRLLQPHVSLGYSEFFGYSRTMFKSFKSYLPS